MSCHGLYCSSFLVFVLLSCYVCLDLEPNQEKLTTNGTLGSYFGSLLRRFSSEKGFNLFYDSAVISLKQDVTLPSWDPWNLKGKGVQSTKDQGDLHNIMQIPLLQLA